MRVTVVVPCYNNVTTLTMALESFRNQYEASGELVVLDNGSTDGTSQIIDLYVDENPTLPIHIFKIEQSIGNAALKNLAVRSLWDSTDIFMFLRPTSVLFPYGLKRVTETAMASPRVGLIYGDEVCRGSKIYKVPYSPEAISKDNIVGGDYAITKHGASLSGPFDEDLKGCEDYDLVLRVASKTVSVHIPYSITRSSVLWEEDDAYKQKVLEKHGS